MNEVDDIRCQSHEETVASDEEFCEDCDRLQWEALNDEEIEAEEAELASAAVEWAKTVGITVRRIPDDVGEQAVAYFADRQRPGRNGLIAYVRHHLTNYDALLMELSRFPKARRGGPAYHIIRERVDERVELELDGQIELDGAD